MFALFAATMARFMWRHWILADMLHIVKKIVTKNIKDTMKGKANEENDACFV